MNMVELVVRATDDPRLAPMVRDLVKNVIYVGQPAPEVFVRVGLTGVVLRRIKDVDVDDTGRVVITVGDPFPDGGVDLP